MNIKLLILFGILTICLILGILIQNKNKYLEAFSNKLAKIDGTELYFVHIPKNAGTAILKHLCNNEQIGHTKLKDINDINVVKIASLLFEIHMIDYILFTNIHNLERKILLGY